MEWSFQQPSGGVIAVRESGDTAVCQALIGRADPGRGLWKAWLQGRDGETFLGTLIPEGGCLRLRRTIPVEQLRRQGSWPPTGGCLRPNTAPPSPPRQPTAPPVPAGWTWRQSLSAADCPDPRLLRTVQGSLPCLFRRQGTESQLAWPWTPTAPFPVPELFCLCRIVTLEGEQYVVLGRNRQ